MKIKITKTGSGLTAGDVKDVPNQFGMAAINSGIAEEVKSEVKKESKPELITKEEKSTKKKKSKK